VFIKHVFNIWPKNRLDSLALFYHYCDFTLFYIILIFFQFINFLKPLHKLDLCRSDLDLKIIDAVSITKKFVKDNPNILFTRADKDNTVVALDKNEYINNMETCLSDSDTYIRLKHNPIKKLFHELKTMLKRWNNLKYVSSHSYSFLNTSNAILPRAYGLPKIHKAGYSLRIIVSSTGSRSTTQSSTLFTQDLSKKLTTF